MTTLFLSWKSPYLEKIVFILKQVPESLGVTIIDGLVKALELSLSSCTNPSNCSPEPPAKFQNEMSFSIEVWELAR